MKEKNTAAFLALFLGGLGAHHFYLGNSTKALLYLFFCWTFIPGIISFIEAIQLLSMNENKFHLQYNQDYLETPVTDYENLERLHSLHEKGVLNKEEFEKEKKKLIA